jgi:hypothetical protein
MKGNRMKKANVERAIPARGFHESSKNRRLFETELEESAERPYRTQPVSRTQDR